MSSQDSAIGARIRSARKSREWSQKELAAAAGVAEGTVARVERGEKVRPGNLYSIRVTLGIESDEPQGREEMPASVQLALDIVQKWLLAQPTEEARDAAANELTRYIVSRM